MTPYLLAFLWMWLSPTLIDGRCSACLYEGHKSFVYEGTCSMTLAYCPPYYNEAGEYVVPNCNKTTCTHYCSRGHYIMAVAK